MAHSHARTGVPTRPCTSGERGGRIWLHGLAGGTGPRPVRRLAADITGRAQHRGTRLHGGWEFADGSLADPDDPAGDPIPVMVAGAVMSWDCPQAGEVRAALMLRDLPHPGIGWDGSTMRCEWALAADADQRWTHQMASPLLWLGLVGRQTADQHDDAAAPAALPPSATCMPAVQDLPVEALPPDRLKELLARLTAPDRAEGLLITTTEQGAVLTRAMLAEPTLALWPGLTSLIQVHEEGRQTLAQHLPDRCIPPSAARWFAPATDPINDQVLRSRQMARPHILARLSDRALRVRADTPPTGLAADAAALLNPGGRLVVPAAPDRLQLLRDRTTRLAEELDQARTLLHQRTARLDDHERLLTTARQHSTRLEHELAAARTDLAQRDTLIEELTRRLDAAHAEADRNAAAAQRADQELAEAIRSRALLARLAARGDNRSPDDAATDEPPADFSALITAARKRFTLLAMDDLDHDSARSLDQHPQAAAWRRRTWDALSTLQSYAKARSRGDAVGDLLAYCRSGAPGVVIAAGSIAPGEYEGVRADERFRRARTFPVAPATDPRGEAFFGAHIRLGAGGRPPAPRLHFLDDTSRTGRLYIGYIGPHLPNRRTN